MPVELRTRGRIRDLDDVDTAAPDDGVAYVFDDDESKFVPRAVIVGDPDSNSRNDIYPTGAYNSLRLFNPVAYDYTLGTNPKFTLPVGAQLIRHSAQGDILWGPNYLVPEGSLRTRHVMVDFMYQGSSQRIKFRSGDVMQIGDPPDIAGKRYGPKNGFPYGLPNNQIGTYADLTATPANTACFQLRHNAVCAPYGGVADVTPGATDIGISVSTMTFKNVEVHRDLTGFGDYAIGGHILWDVTQRGRGGADSVMQLTHNGHLMIGRTALSAGDNGALLQVRADQGRNETQTITTGGTVTGGTWDLVYWGAVPTDGLSYQVAETALGLPYNATAADVATALAALPSIAAAGGSSAISVTGGPLPTATLTGTVALYTGYATVEGTATLFTTEVNVGDRLTLNGNSGYVVASITDDTHLTLTDAYRQSNVLAAAIQRDGISVEFVGALAMSNQTKMRVISHLTGASPTIRISKVTDGIPSGSGNRLLTLQTAARSLTGTVAVTNGSPTVTGSGTAFRTDLNENVRVQIGGVTYTVSSIQSDTSLTLTTNYAAGTASGLTMTALIGSVNMFEFRDANGTVMASISQAGTIRSTVGIGTRHVGSSTPTAGATGDMRVGTGKFWVNDGGTWKYASIGSADAILSGSAAGGDLTGTYPNPTVGSKKITGAKINDLNLLTEAANNTATLRFRVSGEAVDRYVLRASGKQEWGDGVSATDIEFDRIATGSVRYRATGTGRFVFALRSTGMTVTGTVTATNGSATVTGSGTSFLSELNEGVRVLLEGTEYTIQTIESNTSLTLTGNYTGAGGAGLTMTSRMQLGNDVFQITDNNGNVMARGAGNGSIRSSVGIGTRHVGSATPTAGATGDIRVGTSKLWINDAGTWKAIPVSTTIANADIASAAAIAYSKLNLSNSIVAGDLTSASVTPDKLKTGGTSGQYPTTDGAGGWTWNTPGAVSLPYFTDKLGSDQVVSGANTYTTILSRSLTTGTWFVKGRVTLTDATASSGVYTVKLTDGTNNYASATCTKRGNAGELNELVTSDVIVLASTQTISFQLASALTGATAKAAAPNNGVGNNATELICIQIA